MLLAMIIALNNRNRQYTLSMNKNLSHVGDVSNVNGAYIVYFNAPHHSVPLVSQESRM